MDDDRDRLVSSALAEARADAEVLGVMLQGSTARGDALPGSDVDLFLLLRPGCARPFAAEVRGGLQLERHFADAGGARAKLRASPGLAYGFDEGRILHDPAGALADLAAFARGLLRDHRTPPAEMAAIVYWLRSARRKIAAARDADDRVRAGFVAATTSWKVLEGIWAINDLPIPPSGALPARLADLPRNPPGWPALFAAMFTGDDRTRIDAVLRAIDWVVGE